MLKLLKIFCGRVIGHAFTVYNAEKEGIWPFFGALGGQFFFGLKRRTYGKPNHG